MEQDDAALVLFQPREHRGRFRLRRHRPPIGGPEIGAENADVARGEPGVERRRIGKSGIAEEGRARLVAGRAVNRLIDRLEAVLDIGPRRLLGDHAHQRMGEAVIGDGVALLGDAPCERRRCRGHSPHHEEGRAHALGLQRVEKLAGGSRKRAVIEGEHHLMVGERKRARIALEPDLEAALRADRQDPRGAERGFLARRRMPHVAAQTGPRAALSPPRSSRCFQSPRGKPPRNGIADARRDLAAGASPRSRQCRAVPRLQGASRISIPCLSALAGTIVISPEGETGWFLSAIGPCS